jgi:hypothetical protein
VCLLYQHRQRGHTEPKNDQDSSGSGIVRTPGEHDLGLAVAYARHELFRLLDNAEHHLAVLAPGRAADESRTRLDKWKDRVDLGLQLAGVNEPS